MQQQSTFLKCLLTNSSLFSAASVQSQRQNLTTYNATDSLDKLARTDYVDFGKCQHSFERFCWSKNGSNYLDVKHKVLKKNDNTEFHPIQNLTKGEADFDQVMRLRNQLVNAAENFGREKNLSLVLKPTMSKDMDEQLEQADLVVDVVDRANRKN